MFMAGKRVCLRVSGKHNDLLDHHDTVDTADS